jgi:glutamate---cysteine ligase / carboxylate-amine ligase
MKFISYSRALINENKWRAARYGIDGNLIDFGKEMEVNCRNLILELLDFIDDVVDELGSRNEINYIHKILANGTGADRQLAVYEKTGSFESVVDYITTQTLVGAG